ncbi:MAG: hypothetical protein D6770_08570 [Anaerolineae bacterium]|nr:MAG: hypothetical protein D6770_08570 [Anaerolineae bacterium]
MRSLPTLFLPFILACALLSPATPTATVVPPTATPAPPTPTVTPSLPLISAPSLTAFHMLDERNGWGLDDNHVLRTEDGGETWYDVTMPEAPELGYAAASFFLDAKTAWVLAGGGGGPTANGTLYRTLDGGLTWSSFTVPFGFGALYFLDANNGWAIADLGVAAGSQAVSIYRTTDGGATWTQTYTNDPNLAGAGESLPLGGLKSRLVARDMQTAWVGGVIYASGTIYLYQTHDGGYTWSQSPLAPPAEMAESQFQTDGPILVSAQEAFLPVIAFEQMSQMLIYRSHDGGETWELTPTRIPNGGSADFFSPAEGVLWNGEQFYLTTDGAQTWSAVTPNIFFGDTFIGMDFVNSKTGWVLSRDTSEQTILYKTTDGGATWEPLVP